MYSDGWLTIENNTYYWSINRNTEDFELLFSFDTNTNLNRSKLETFENNKI